jgi:hypothetical protein
MASMLYAVKIGKVWRLWRNKRIALRWAKAIRSGAEVWSRPDVPEVSAWDWPTFVQGATRVYSISE